MVAEDVAEFSWMWADAGGIFHRLSAINPWRWSQGSLDKILRELLAEPTWRPVELRLAGERAVRPFGSPTEAARWLCERYVEVAVQLQVRHEVAEGEVVVAVGSAVELGAWDEAKAVRLHKEPEDLSLWRSAELGGAGVLVGFDYRYGVTCGGTVQWEEGPNRTVALGCGLEDLAAATCVVLHGGGMGADAQQLQLLSRPLHTSGCSFPLASLGSERGRKRATPAAPLAPVEVPLARQTGPASFGEKSFPRMVWDHRVAGEEVPITDRYALGVTLGEGKFGAVCRAELVHGGASLRTRAVKQVLKDRVESVEDFNREVEVMVLMDHPNTLRLYEVFQDEQYVHLVMELCEGGDMFDFMFNHREHGCPEPEARLIFRQMAAAVQHCHSHNVAHRDLKLENFLLATAVIDGSQQQRPSLKLCDMGLARRVPREGLTNCCGTPTTMAPEVLLSSRGHSYGLACDLWSLGSILYTLLSCMVAQGPTQSERRACSTKWMTRLLKARYDLRGQPWPNLSDDSRDLVRSLMCKDPERRLTAQGCFLHSWLRTQEVPIHDVFSFGTAADVSQGLSRWFGEDRLGHFRKTALHVLAQQGGAEHRMLDAFRRLDTDDDGQVGLRQLVDAMAATLPEGEDNPVVKSWRERILPDMEEGAMLGYTDFLAATMGEASWMEDDRCRDVFDFLDRDGDGAISLADLGKIYPEALAKHEEEVANLGGQVTFECFVALMRASMRRPPSPTTEA